MLSPFVYDAPVEPDELIGRGALVDELLAHALDARNSRLEGPRRFGKTSLLRAVLARADRTAAATVEVNFLGCATTTDVADRIDAAYRASLQGPLKRWLDGLLRTLQPTITAAPGGVGVSVSPRDMPPGLMDRLALPRRIHERSGEICVVAFDEFQEIFRIDPALPGVFRSELESRGHKAGYLFSGSHPGLMRELFADRRHAFFAQAAPVEIGPIPLDELAEGIDARFRAHGRDPGEMLGPLLDAGAGHPQRSMLLAHHLFASTPPSGTSGLPEWDAADRAARRAAFAEIRELWDGLTGLDRRIVRALADGERSLTSGEARQRYSLPKGGSVTSALRRLTDRGHVVDAGFPALVDPFLARWLREADR